MADNRGPGILVRRTVHPVEVHSCRVSGCQIERNAADSGRGQVDVLGEAHDLAFTDNEIDGLGPEVERAGIYLGPSAGRIWMHRNRIRGCFPAVVADPASLAEEEGTFGCGVEAAQDVHYRHLYRGSTDRSG
jgi:hypothetical protein